MDYKVFRTAMLAIVSALILVLVIVYATNADKINELFGKGEASNAGASAATYSSANGSAYGEQIGDNTQGFLNDVNFFDDYEEIPSVVIEKNESTEQASAALGSSSDIEYEDYIAPASVVGTN
ncbi:MAG: hypothetical protein J5802_03590 [Butyrivibrio sp.]|nr:hypothetical protein [Butyrivibrio sp.]